MTYTFGGSTKYKVGPKATLRSLENDDASGNTNCDGYQKVMCFATANTDYDGFYLKMMSCDTDGSVITVEESDEYEGFSVDDWYVEALHPHQAPPN